MTKHLQMRLKQAREEHGWSQKDVAEQIGTDPKTVSRWERGVAHPAPYFRQKLADLFQKSLRELDLVTSDDAQKPPDGAEDTARQSAQPLIAVAPPTQPAHMSLLSLENRKRMLRRLRRTYAELLQSSLEHLTWIELGLAGMQGAVQNAANRLVQRREPDTQALTPCDSILEVYESSEHELLILGEPGTGKSSLLLHLALTLVERSERDAAHPLPVILYLSSWAEQQLPLKDWMSEQLALTYDVSPSLCAQWLRDEQVIPLLDGLDEMNAAFRPVCIAAINAYHREHLLVPLVICSRRSEYEDAAQCEKLALQRAVVIQPLTCEQVYTALEQTGQPLDTIRQALETNPALREMVTTPLMLSILLLTYSRAPASMISLDTSTLRGRVWSDYVAHMAGLKGDAGHYSLQQTCSWLSWLARNLEQHYQTVFYLEHIQSDWLPESLRQKAFQLTLRVPLVFLGMLSSLVIGLLFETVVDMTTGIQAVIIGALLGACFSQPAIAFPEKRAFRSAPKKVRGGSLAGGLISAGVGVLAALSFGGELGPGYGVDDWVRDGRIYGGSLALFCWLLLVLVPRISARRMFSSRTRAPAQQVRRLVGRNLWLALLVAAGLGVSYGLSTGLSYGWDYGPSAGLNIALSYGCVAFLIGLIVENYRGDIRLTEQLRWTWNGLRSARHCISSGALAVGVLLVVGLSYGLTVGLGTQKSPGLGFRLSYGLSDGLSSGLSAGPSAGLVYGLIMGVIVGVGSGLGYWLVLGLFQSIAQEQLEDEDRRRPNQGVLYSARNSAVIGSIGFLGDWLSYGLNAGLSKGTGFGLTVGLRMGSLDALSAVWLFAVGGGIIGWSVSGGCAVLQHVLLRWLLDRRRIFPWQAQEFLDEATSRILLRRVGGGYSFIHRLLLEHFAELEEAAETRLPALL